MKAVILVLALVSAAACSKQSEAYASTAGSSSSAPAPGSSAAKNSTPKSPAPEAAVPSNDLALIAAVRAAVERQTSLQNIEVQVSDGRVTLTGSVATPVEKDVAEAAAKGVPGVRGVDNQLMVKGS